MATGKNASVSKKDKFLKAMRARDGTQPPKVLYKSSVQDSIPIYAVHEKENLIETYPGFFTRSYWIKENNYQSESEQRQEEMYIEYRKVLNSLGVHEEYSLTVMNRRIDMRSIEESVLNKETGDKHDGLRREMNQIIVGRIEQGRNGLEKIKYFTIGLHCDSVKKAAEVFNRSVDRRMSERFKKIESDATPIDIHHKLELLHDIYNPDDQGTFLTHKKRLNASGTVDDIAEFDLSNLRSQGCTVKDVIGPSCLVVCNDHLEMGSKYVRSMRIDRLPSTMGDDFFCRLTDVDFNIITTVNIRPIPSTDAQKLVMKNLTLARSEMSKQRKKLIQSDLPEELVSDDLRDNVEHAEDMREEMLKNDERLFKTTYTVVFWADSLEELDEHTETITTACQTDAIGIQVMSRLQEEGFNATLPLCYNELPYRFQRTLKSSSATIFFPFSILELSDPGGINYSCNLYSKNLIVYDRTKTMNANGFILGKPGYGKSFAAKTEILGVILGSNSDCIIIDPEGEYNALAKLIDGQEIKIEPGGKWHINPLEIDTNYSWDFDDDSDTTETNPVYAKCTFIIRLIETMLDSPLGISAVQKTIVDECVRRLYDPFMDEQGNLMPIPPEKMPTLVDLQREFAKEAKRVPEARELEYCLKLYTEGSLNTFAYQSNVDLHNRFISYNIRDVGEELKPLAMMIILDSLFTTMFRNKRVGKYTWMWIDEIYLMFQSEKSAQTLNEMFKRSRKHGGVPTGITQNVEDLLESDTARKMLSNSNFVQILTQAPSDLEKLQTLLNLSQSQVEVVTSAPRGQGLIYTGGNCVSFFSQFPKNNSIYRCLTSSMKEIREYEEEERRKRAHDVKAQKKRSLVNPQAV